jgi:hypothetical protein
MDELLKIADIQAIRDLLHHYAFCIDSRQSERLGEVFSTSVEAGYGYGEEGVWHGLDELIDGIATQIGTFEGSAHMIGNVRVEVDGDLARSTCYVSAWHWVAGSDTDPERGADFLLTCVYLDDLKRGTEGWRIVRRRLRRLGPSALTAGRMPDNMRPVE